MSDVITTTPKAGGWLQPATMGEAMELATIFAKSGLVPKAYAGNPSACFVAMAFGESLGMAPLQAMQSVAVVNGYPAVYGDGMLALAQASPSFEDIEEDFEDGVATCTVKRKGRRPVVRTFGEADAKKAQLWGKAGPWQQYPQRMLQMRARSWALRDAFADVLRGLQSVEEMRDVPPDVIDVTPAPAAAPAAALPAPKATGAEKALAKVRAAKAKRPEPPTEPEVVEAAEPAEPNTTGPVEPPAVSRDRIAEIGAKWKEIYQDKNNTFVQLLRALYQADKAKAAGMTASIDKAIEALDPEDHANAQRDVMEILLIVEATEP